MMAWNPNIVIASMGLNTTDSPTPSYTTAYGTDVGQTITKDFINDLPASYDGWYDVPSGLTTGGNCPGVAADLTLPNVSPSGCVLSSPHPSPTRPRRRPRHPKRP